MRWEHLHMFLLLFYCVEVRNRLTVKHLLLLGVGLLVPGMLSGLMD